MTVFTPGFNNQQNRDKQDVKSAQVNLNKSNALFDAAEKSDPTDPKQDQAIIADLKKSQTAPDIVQFNYPKVDSLVHAENKCNEGEKNPQVQAKETTKETKRPN